MHGRQPLKPEQENDTPRHRSQRPRQTTLQRIALRRLRENRWLQLALIAATAIPPLLIFLYGDGVIRPNDDQPTAPDPSPEPPSDSVEELNCTRLESDLMNILMTGERDDAALEAISALARKSSESNQPDPLLECATQIAKIPTFTADRDRGLERIIDAYVAANRCDAARDLVTDLSLSEQRDAQFASIATRCLGNGL